jgi:hypothetical protein
MAEAFNPAGKTWARPIDNVVERRVTSGELWSTASSKAAQLVDKTALFI